MKTYTATRLADGQPSVTVREEKGPLSSSRPLAHVLLHSPDGFEWGYHGSGPAELALAILADVLNEQPTPAQVRAGQPLSVQLHQLFKRDEIAGFGRSGFSLSEESVWRWLASYGIEFGKTRPTRDQLAASLMQERG